MNMSADFLVCGYVAHVQYTDCREAGAVGHRQDAETLRQSEGHPLWLQAEMPEGEVEFAEGQWGILAPLVGP